MATKLNDEIPASMFAQFARQVAPLVEGEKVLIDWLETHGIVYADGGYALGWGYMVQQTNGIDPRRMEPPFSTYAQCLEWCLTFAAEHIQNGEHARTIVEFMDEFTTELAGLGVDPDIFMQATANMAQRRANNLKNV